MANNNLGGRERRKPGIQALPEKRRRGVTIRFLPEMKNDIYDLRDWLETEGPKGKRLLSQILKYQGKIDDLLTKLKGNKKEEETSLPPLPALQDLDKDKELQDLRAENHQLREQLNKLGNLFADSICKDNKTMVHANFHCLVADQARRLLRNPQNPST
jgi:hypothetical protein